MTATEACQALVSDGFAAWSGASAWGVVLQQLLVHPDIPMTSHNSAACAVLDIPNSSLVEELVAIGVAIIENYFEGSDPGLCVATEGDVAAIARLQAFGRLAAVEVTTKAAARIAAAGVHLSEHGGTGGGIIGAAAGVGLTAAGSTGRLIECHVPLCGFARVTCVGDIEAAGIRVLANNRKERRCAGADDIVDTHDWFRPRLWGAKPRFRSLGMERALERGGDAAGRRGVAQAEEGTAGAAVPSTLLWSGG